MTPPISPPTTSPDASAVEAVADASEHRVRALVEIRALLKQFVEGDVPLALTTPDGLNYRDGFRNVISRDHREAHTIERYIFIIVTGRGK